MKNRSFCFVDSRHVVDLFNDDDDGDDDGDIFKQISSRPATENAGSGTTKHKVWCRTHMDGCYVT